MQCPLFLQSYLQWLFCPLCTPKLGMLNFGIRNKSQCSVCKHLTTFLLVFALYTRYWPENRVEKISRDKWVYVQSLLNRCSFIYLNIGNLPSAWNFLTFSAKSLRWISWSISARWFRLFDPRTPTWIKCLNRSFPLWTFSSIPSARN